MKSKAFLLKFSYRNLWRSPKRTLILILSLVLGSGFIIWDLNFAVSGSKEMMKNFLSQYQGFYHITHKDYYDFKNRKLFDNYKTLKDSEIEDASLLLTTTKRVTAPVFASGMSKTLGILLTGLDVTEELRLCSLQKMISKGRFLNATGAREIIIGQRLAERINVKLGDEVAVIGQATDGSVANDLLTVVGLLDMGGGDLEESLAFTQIATAQDLMVLGPDVYHQRVSFDKQSETIPKLKNLAATSWEDIIPEISVSVKFVDKLTWLVSFIIMLVISLGLSNTLMITFFEREQEFQSLNIIGAKTSWITTSLMLEVFLMGTFAIILGDILGYFFTWLCHIYPVDISLFTGGKPIIMGGMVMKPTVRLYSVPKHYWQVPLLIYFFLSLTMIYPMIKVVRRSKNAI